MYNEIGQLRYVLTPKIQQPGINFSAEYYYEYRYDERGRVKTKILPGCKAIEYWYDKADRIAYMKDPALGSRYRFYLYDKLGRLCVQGTCTDGTRDSTQLSTTSYVSGTNNGICKTGYTAPYTISNPKLEIVNYYDNYNFKDKQQKSNMPAVTVNDNQKQYSIGSLTGTVVYATNGEALGMVNVYDQKGQVVRSVRRGLRGFVEDVNTAYTFTGDVDNTTANVNVKYGYGNFSAQTQYAYEYGKNTEMILSVRHGSTTQTRKTEYDYDFTGRLTSKSRHLEGTYKSYCSYTYDVHGWLTYINSGGFLEYLYYADTGGIDDTKYYNGNISAYKWKNRNDNDYKGYVLKYDDNNRLREAVYGEGNTLSSYKNYFNEYVDEYDRNGNILRLKRGGLKDSRHGGFGYVDDLYMTYSGNKLISVRDNATHDAYNGATDFKPDSNDKTKSYPLTYNEAGSLVSDAGRDIAYIRYDNNNNPVLIVFKDGHETEYVYSATGEKLRVIYTTAKPHVITREIGKDITERLPENYRVSTPETIDYLLGGALTLRNGVIDKYQFEEGYCQATPLYWEGKPFAETFTFCYYDQDHLGNIRQVTMDDGSKKGEVIQRMNYYPFGAEFCDNSTKSYVQNHKYNGKEFDNMHGLNTYDYGARQYNPVTGRWDRMDRYSEKYYPHSPYVYCKNNPMIFTDPDGDTTRVSISNVPSGLQGPLFIIGTKNEWKNVDLYPMTVTDDKCDIATNYLVTRDALTKKNGVITNYAFEPEGNEGTYDGVIHDYPRGKGVKALVLMNNKSMKLKTDSQRPLSPYGKKQGEVEGAMIHVGGWYDWYEGGTHMQQLAGSEACFGVAGGTESITRFINDILERMDRNGDKAVRITIEKRENIWK